MDEKLKLCLVGCGRVSHSHFEGIGELKDMIDLVSVVDMDEERAKQATKTYGAKKYYLSTAEAFKDPEVEAVDLCLPYDQHCSVAIEAANMGKHILVEKPMANTVKEVDQMVEAADRNNVTLMVGQSRRFYDTVMKSKQLIEEGQIGRLFSIRVNYLGCVTKPAVPWWSSDRIKGLIIPLFGSHLIDYVLWVKDNPVTRVYAETYSNNPVWN